MEIIVSHIKYVTYIDTNHRSHNYFSKLSNDDARLEAVINGIPSIVEPVDIVFKPYEGWIRHPETLVVRFKDFVGARRGVQKKNDK